MTTNLSEIFEWNFSSEIFCGKFSGKKFEWNFLSEIFQVKFSDKKHLSEIFLKLVIVTVVLVIKVTIAIVTAVWVPLVTITVVMVLIVTYFSKNNLTPQKPMRFLRAAFRDLAMFNWSHPLVAHITIIITFLKMSMMILPAWVVLGVFLPYIVLLIKLG